MRSDERVARERKDIYVGNPKRILWMSRHVPLPSQRKELERLFPGHLLITESRPFSSAEQIVRRYRENRGDEMVVVAPWSVVRQIIRLGIKPIYAEMRPCSKQEAESVIVSGRSQHKRYYCFVKFHYCTDVALKLEPIIPNIS